MDDVPQHAGRMEVSGGPAEVQRRAAEAKGMWLRNYGIHVRSQSRLLYGLLHEIDKQVESSARTPLLGVQPQ